MDTEIIEQVKDYGRYVKNRERWTMNGQPPAEFLVYRTHGGAYIGVQDKPGRRPALIKIIDKYEITPELAGRGHGVCSIGKSAVNGKWYGWSHRAISKFATRAQAVRFARSVS
jgi:hypothetical protein